MENFSYSSYPESGDSSPRSREIEYESPTPWDDQQLPQNYKVKLMCSYGGKILPRPHDNQLCYIGGETKILAVDRNIKFSFMISKLSSLCETDVSFKYQLPGEDLDALISVSNDDDLEHMMHEYDRIYRASSKPVRMRLFLFPVKIQNSTIGSYGSDRDPFVIEAMNSGSSAPQPNPRVKSPVQNNVDFLFGLEKGVGVSGVAPPQPPLTQPTVAESLVPSPEFQIRPGVPGWNQVTGSDPMEIQRQVQEFQRLQIGGGDHEPGLYRRKSDENYSSGGGEYYVPRVHEKLPQVSVPPPVSTPVGYWPEKQVQTGGVSAPVTATPGMPDQPFYVIPAAPGPVYRQQPMVRQVTGPTGQAYYSAQRMASDIYREQPVYNMVPPPQPQPNFPPQPAKVPATTYSDGVGMVGPNGGLGTGSGDSRHHAQVAYDSAGRQVYYTTAGGMMVPPSRVVTQPQPQPQHQQVYQAVAAPEMRNNVPLGQEGKVVLTKVSGSSV